MKNITFEPDATEFDPAQPEDIAGLATNAKRYGLPHLQDFMQNVITSSCAPDEAAGRRYQRETIARRALQIVSPLTGESVFSARSFAIRGRVFYHFAEAVEYLVISSTIRSGYPLSALFLPGLNRVLAWYKLRRLRPILGILARIAGSEKEANCRPLNVVPVVMIGHRNFAHHLWNELSALERLLKEPLAPPPEIMIGREPLGPVEAIFPEIVDWEITRTSEKEGLSGNDLNKLYVNLGGFLVSQSLRARIVHHASASAKEDTHRLARRLRQSFSPVFWLSVRTHAPTFVDQRDVLVTVARRLLEQYPHCGILLDGFSFPEDWPRTADATQEFYKSAAASSRGEIDGIIAELFRVRPPVTSQLIANLGGLQLVDSITLAQVADAYFCHKGTVQHKIGWTANIPGIIHGPRCALIENMADWHASRLDSAVRPIAIEPEMIADVDDTKESNYRAVDREALAAFVTDQFAQYVSQIGSIRRRAQPT